MRISHGLQRISTKDMPHDKWLECRRHSVGGSDAAAILGLSRWSSPYAVWAEKTGLTQPAPDNEAMRIGRDLESYIAARWFEATGKRVRRDHAIIKNAAYPFAHANVDRMVVGERAGLECKSTSALNMKSFKNGEYPVNYYVQCMHYMAVTGADKWYLAVLVLGREFLTFEIPRDDDEIAVLMAQEAEFWVNVIHNTPPPMDGATATTDALKEVYAQSSLSPGITLHDRRGDIDEYFAQKTLRDTADQKMEEIQQRIMQDLGENEQGECDDFVITWKSQTRRTFDTKKFADNNPDLDLSAYYKTSTFRKFSIKEAI